MTVSKRRDFGSLHERAKGVWTLRWRFDGEAGSETYRGTKRGAEARLAQIRVELEARGSSSRQTVAYLWEHSYRPWIADLAPQTREGYESAYRARIEPRFGGMVPDDIKPAEVQEWLLGMTYGAARKAMATLRAFMNRMEDADLVERNFMRKRYKLPKKSDGAALAVNDTVHDAATLHQIFLDCRGEPWEPGFIMSAFAGLRREEAFGVKWEDVTFLPGMCVVAVRRGVQVVREAGGIAQVDLKTADSQREVPMPDPYAARLRQIRDERPGEEWVMDGGFGVPMNPESTSAMFKRWHLGRPYAFAPWKNLRNSYATMLHEAGVELGLIGKLLGHTTPAMTYRHYSKPTLSAKSEAVLLIARAVAVHEHEAAECVTGCVTVANALHNGSDDGGNVLAFPQVARHAGERRLN